MELTREEALKLHREMWTDMLKELGEEGDIRIRGRFKTDWLEKHFSATEDDVANECFLCEYARQWYYEDELVLSGDDYFVSGCCEYCPIEWRGDHDDYRFACERGSITWDESPISEILALPERGV